ncbi:MAG: prolipoprotein diacylglyceryl transferase family protein [Anaerolineales bacterium]
MFPILQVGPVAIQVPGFILLAGLWIGLTFSERLLAETKRPPVPLGVVSNLALVSLLAGALGARLGYVLTFPSAFQLNPWNLLSLNPGLLHLGIGLIAAIVAATIYSQRQGLAALLMLDVFTPLLAVLSTAWFFSSLASGANFGLLTELPWAINLFGSLRHPSQIYDTLVAALILAALWWQRRSFQLGDGRLFFVFLAFTAGSRVFLEAFHATGPSVLEGWRINQILAWLVLAFSLWILRNPKGSKSR